MRHLLGSSGAVSLVLALLAACSSDDSGGQGGGADYRTTSTGGGSDGTAGHAGSASGSSSGGTGGSRAGDGGSRSGAGARAGGGSPSGGETGENGGTEGSGGSQGGGVANAGNGGSRGSGGSNRGGAATGNGGKSGSGGKAGGDGGSGPGGGGADAGAGGSGTVGGVVTYGQTFSGGQFHLGPVDWEETEWHNACAPLTKYAPTIRQAEGDLLAGLWNGIPDVAGYCDVCIYVTTAMGKSAVLRVVTYGDTTANSIDVSPAAYALLNSGEYPRTMAWAFAECPDTGNIVYEFQTGSSEWWTSLWVRNARVPLARVEVTSPNHGTYFALTRGSDGTLTDPNGFGNGPFSIRLTGVDGRQIVDSFGWPAAGIAGQSLTGQGNFQ